MRTKNEKMDLAKKEGWFSLIMNTILFVLKYWVGIISGSVALIADAWHTLSDSLTSVIMLFGIKVASKPADSDHPFGHGRAEWIAALIIGTILGVIGFNFLYESIEKLFDHTGANYGIWAIIITVISVVAKEVMAQYAFWIYKKTSVKSVRADGWHHRSDALSSLLILVGILFGSRYWWIDGVMGIFVSLALFYAAYGIIKESAQSIMGEEPDNKLIQKLEYISFEVIGQDVHLHHIHIHNYGDHTELTCHIKLQPELTLHNAHEIATKIENAIREETGIIATIHMEPKKLNV